MLTLSPWLPCDSWGPRGAQRHLLGNLRDRGGGEGRASRPQASPTPCLRRACSTLPVQEDPDSDGEVSARSGRGPQEPGPRRPAAPRGSGCRSCSCTSRSPSSSWMSS